MMNYVKLFTIQAHLDNHINIEHPIQESEDRLAKKVLALQVELGECANEWRGFKFWSKNQQPRNYNIPCHSCKGFGNFHLPGMKGEVCLYCEGTGIQEKNPLLMEYVDCLHFILSIGITLNFRMLLPSKKPIETNVIDLFNLLFEHISFLRDKECQTIEFYSMVFEEFVTLGEMLGFTWNEIEAAYLEKNKVNHERQATGY